MSPFEIIKGTTEVLGGKGISLKSDHVTTTFFQCEAKQCEWREEAKLWLVDSGFNWPFRSWLACEVWVLVLFEHNGCDINNARLALSPKSFNRWYNDKAKFQISAKGAPSKLSGATGCRKCCEASAIVDFDVDLIISYDLVRTDNMFWTVRIIGDGTVQIINR